MALIVAGGDGNRFGNGKIPKQYFNLADVSVLERTVKTFALNENIHKIQVVIKAGHEGFYQHINEKKLLPVVHGGKRRQDSVCNGLEAIEKHHPEFVLIHDGVRPFVSSKLIGRVVNELKTNLAVVPALSVTDSIVQVDDYNKIEKYINRNVLQKIQTPQGFDFASILHCYKLEKNSRETFTDEGVLLRKYGIPVTTVFGEERNIKITFKEDLLHEYY